MTTAYTSLLGLALPVTGELQGTWGDTVNNSITSLLDTAVAGTTTLSTDGDVTLTTTTGATNQSRQAILLCSGARTALRTITAPAQSKIYTVINATTGGYAVKIVGVGPTTGVTIPAGQTATVAWNGSDFVDASNYINGNLKVNGTVTLSAGTANGVAYLNGSKVLTTGTALVFDGTSLGIGTSSPAATNKVQVSQTSTTDGATAIAVTCSGTTTGSNYGLYSSVSGASVKNWGLYVAAGESYLSGNLGLGVTPSAWASTFKPIQLGAGGSFITGRTGTTSQIQLGANAYYDGTDWRYINANSASRYYQSAGVHYWETAPVWSGTGSSVISFIQAMTLDASGNLGVASTSPSGKLEVSGGVSFSRAVVLTADGGGGAYVTARGSNGVDYNTDLYLQARGNNVAGQIIFQTGVTGTYTEKARIDSSGNLGVGTTSPSAKLQVNTTNFALATSYATLTSNAAIRTTDSAATNVGGELALGGYNSGTSNASDFVRLHGKKENGTAGNVSGYFAVEVAYDGGPAPYMFERMRIDSSGSLLVGTTTNGSNFKSVIQFVGSGTNGLFLNNTASAGSPTLLQISNSGYAPNNTDYSAAYSDTAAQRWVLRFNGGLSNYQANNTNLSDRREKTNFAPAGDYLAKICAIPVQTFNYIDQNLEEDGGLTLGVVAQDVQAVAPELVMESNWGTKDSPKMRLSIYQTDLQYALMKCIQEQQALIESLKARLDAANL